MPDLLLQALIGLSLLLAAAGLVHVVTGRPPGGLVLSLVFILTVALLVGLFAGILALGEPGNQVSRVTYLGYLGGSLLAPPAAALWAAEEQSRAGSAIYLAVGLLVAFLLVRSAQVWAAGV